MNDQDIRKYATLMKELELSALEITDEGKSVRLERGGAAPAPKTVQVPEAPAEGPEARGRLVTSPIVGVFYRAGMEGADPFVEEGSSVRKGDTLCIIESMKIMNELKADSDFTILEVLAANGSLVEFGTPLFRVE